MKENGQREGEREGGKREMGGGRERQGEREKTKVGKREGSWRGQRLITRGKKERKREKKRRGGRIDERNG